MAGSDHKDERQKQGNGINLQNVILVDEYIKYVKLMTSGENVKTESQNDPDCILPKYFRTRIVTVLNFILSILG